LRAAVKIAVDYERCASNAVCMRIAPELFEVRDDGDLYVLNDSPSEEARALVVSAIRACPTRALSVED
jgi:ferredoxin